MKITEVKTCIVGNPWKNWLFVKVYTDAGIVGLGEATGGLATKPNLGDVEDIGQARADLEAKGVEFVTPIDRGPNGDAWCYFAGPDGFLYEIWQPADAVE